jgi:hypothetical protein
MPAIKGAGTQFVVLRINRIGKNNKLLFFKKISAATDFLCSFFHNDLNMIDFIIDHSYDKMEQKVLPHW